MGSLRSSAQAHDLGHLATESLAANRNQSSTKYSAGAAGVSMATPSKTGVVPAVAGPQRQPPRPPGMQVTARPPTPAQQRRSGEAQGSRRHADPAGDRLEERVALRERRPGEQEERKRKGEGSRAEPRVPGQGGETHEEGDEAEAAQRHAEGPERGRRDALANNGSCR